MKLVSLYSTIKMMHGPINIRCTNTETAVSETQHGLLATIVAIFSYSWSIGYEIKLRQLNSFCKYPTGCSCGLSSYSGSEVFSRGMLLMEL